VPSSTRIRQGEWAGLLLRWMVQWLRVVQGWMHCRPFSPMQYKLGGARIESYKTPLQSQEVQHEPS
jgi:hypothetical protein